MPDFERIVGPVLCIAAHPEDIEIHAGGTVARLVQAGHEVAYVLCSSGNRGTGDPTLTPEEVAATREAEQRRAAVILGVQDITFLGHDDGDLQYVARELREQVVRLIRQKRPRTIITHDPFPGDGSHDSCAIYPDHLTVGRVVFEATLVCAPGPLFYPEHLREGPSTSRRGELVEPSGHRL
ncbi:MAG: PIG-L deacetylase family protein [Anaerolineae bacterium]